jgi:hypothetical protein
MRSATTQIAQEYERIQKHAIEDPGTAGDEGEKNWAELLRRWLPKTYTVVTKGRILSQEGTASPHVDVLVLFPSYPPGLVERKLYLAAGVAAAFECKVTLKPKHIRKAIENAAAISRLSRKRTGNPYLELHSGLIYGLLAHSHTWKSDPVSVRDRVSGYIREADSEVVTHPQQMLDLLCVANLATWSTNRIVWLGPSNSTTTSHGATQTFYVGQDEVTTEIYPPVGVMVAALFHKLAWADPGLRPLADYYGQVLPLHTQRGAETRHWSAEIYSDETRPRVEAGQLDNNGFLWSMWNILLD